MLFSVLEQDSHLELRFHAKQSANAFSLLAARELRQLARDHRGWDKPVVVRSAHPRVFCSGGNLKEYSKLKGKAAGLKVNREIASCLDAFGAWAPVKIAWIDGDVLGGGMEWLGRFDFRLSSPESVFAFWQRRIGLSTGWGGGKFWAVKVGEEKLKSLLIAAEPLPAVAALRAGLVDRLIPSWQADVALALFTADLSGKAVLAAKGWSSKSEQKIFASLWMSEEHKAVLERWR